MREEVLPDVEDDSLGGFGGEAGADGVAEGGEGQNAHEGSQQPPEIGVVAVGHGVVQHPLADLGNEQGQDGGGDAQRQRQQHFSRVAFDVNARPLEVLDIERSFQVLVNGKGIPACRHAYSPPFPASSP